MPSAFGENLRAIRLKRRLTQERLGEITGIDQSTISKYENGASSPEVDGVVRLAAALDVGLDALVAGENAEYDLRRHGVSVERPPEGGGRAALETRVLRAQLARQTKEIRLVLARLAGLLERRVDTETDAAAAPPARHRARGRRSRG